MKKSKKEKEEIVEVIVDETTYDLTKLLKMGESFDLNINPKIERKLVNGNWGMYATEDIDSNEYLITSKAPNIVEHTNTIEMLGKYAQEMEKGDDSDLKPFFDSWGNMDEWYETASYYTTKEEFTTIAGLSPLIAYQLSGWKDGCDVTVQSIIDDYKVEKKTAEFITVAYQSRTWDVGFMPGFDLFNHSARRGAPMYKIERDGTDIYTFIATNSYKKGDEIFVSYQRNDSTQYTINMNFYDNHDIHMNDILHKLVFKKDSENEEDARIYNTLKESYSTTTFGDNNEYYKINAIAPIILSAPSTTLTEIAKVFATDVDGNLNEAQLSSVLLEWCKHSMHIFTIGVLKAEMITTRVQRFLALIQSENRLIESTMDYITTDNPNYNEKFLKQYISS